MGSANELESKLQIMPNELRQKIERLAQKPYGSEKLLLEAIGLIDLEAEILGNDLRRICYILKPERADAPKGTSSPCFEMRLKPGDRPGKIITGFGFWW